MSVFPYLTQTEVWSKHLNCPNVKLEGNPWLAAANIYFCCGRGIPVEVGSTFYWRQKKISPFYNSIFPQTQYISFFSFLGLKKKRAVFNYKELCSAEMAKVIIPLHDHTGGDAVSGFSGQGKMSVWHKVEKRPQEQSSPFDACDCICTCQHMHH